MKKVLWLIQALFLLVLIQQLVSCKKEVNPTEKENVVKTISDEQGKMLSETKQVDQAGIASRELISSAFDPTFRIEVRIWGEYANCQYPHAEVSVDPDFVLIGGGARVSNSSNTSSGVNALLTAAYPKNDGQFATFVADSKEHLIPHYHRLWVYAIGMRLIDVGGTPIPASTIKSLMNITTVTSGFSGQPTATANIPSGYLMLSGGAQVNWLHPGNLLVKSMPLGLSWTAKAKDHLQVSSATITSSALSINPTIPGFGVLEGGSFIVTQKTNNGVQGNVNLNTASIPGGGYLLSGIGAESTYNGVGRMLFGLYPTSATTATVNDKDHSQVDSGRLFGVVFGIKKQ
jgi:hypothetical protein